MAYRLKYYAEHRSANNKLYRLEIRGRNFSGTAVEVDFATDTPFIITSNEQGIYDTITGSGIEFTLLSRTALQFIDLYTVDIYAYRLRVFKDGVIMWAGWLDSEMYNEDYKEDSNYPVTFTGNDGIALLDRVNYLDRSTQQAYKGLDKAWYVLGKALQFMFPYGEGVSIFTHLYFGTSHNYWVVRNYDTTVPYNETILHQIEINQENYIDELLETKTAREVIDAILQPLGLKARYNANTNDLYIYDYHMLTRGSDIVFKRFGILFDYIDTVTITPDDLTFDFIDDGLCNMRDAQMTFTDPVSKQEIKYSPYTLIKVMDIKIDSGYFPVDYASPDWYDQIERCICTDPQRRFEQWRLTAGNHFEFPLIDGARTAWLTEEIAGCFSASYKRHHDHYIYVQTPDTDYNLNKVYFKTTITTNTLFGYDNIEHSDFTEYGLYINYKMMVDARDCLNDDPGNSSQVFGYIGISINGTRIAYTAAQFDVLESNVWTSPNAGDLEGVITDVKNIAYNGAFKGTLQLEFLHDWTVNMKDLTILFKDIEVRLIDMNHLYETGEIKDITNKDVVAEGTVNAYAKDEGEGIDLIHGWHTTTGATERGGFLYESPTVANSYVYADRTDQDILDTGGSEVRLYLDESLLNNIISNRRDPAVNLSDIIIPDSIDMLPVAMFTDNARFGQRKMLPYSWEYDPVFDEVKISVVEIKKITYEIVNVG